jgi:hypothetical protein
MKKLIFLFSFLIAAVAVLAQVDTSTVVLDPPTSWLEIPGNLNKWFGGLGGMAAITLFVAGVLNGLLKVEKKFVRQLIAWLVGVAVAIVGQVANVGFLAEVTWTTTLLYGLVIGLVANGLFNVPTGLGLIKALEGLLGNKR